MSQDRPPALDDLLGMPRPHADTALPARGHRRSESEATASFALPRPFGSGEESSDLAGGSPRWKTAGSRAGGNTPLYNKHRVSTSTKLFGSGSRRRFGSNSSPTHRQSSSQGLRHGKHGWKVNESSTPEEDDGSPKLVSLSDLIRKEDKVPATLLYEHAGDTDVTMDVLRDMGGGVPQEAINGGAVGTQDALQAAEHGNSIRLSKFLQDGGDPGTVSRLHHMRWSLLHLAAGCATMGGRLSFASYRSRPEPDCNDGYATCVSELLAAGADPNVTSNSRGYTPLMSAALTGSKECCWLLLRAGARLDRKADDGRTAYDFAQNARHVGGGSTGGPRDSFMAVLRNPPKKVPRSPILVSATLATVSCSEPEEAPPVEVRWRAPSQSSLAPSSCGDVERYYVKCWCRGKGKEVMRTKTSTSDVPRRDFCRNQIIDRGIALRKNLCLPQSRTASVIMHGLQAGEIYSFTVSCVAEVEGALRHSPPSCMSKPLLIPESKEDSQWRLGGMLSMVTGKDSPLQSGAGESGVAQSQARARGADQSPKIVDQRRGPPKKFSVSWAKDDIAPTQALRQTTDYQMSENLSAYHPDEFGRSLPGSGKEWDSATNASSRSPGRRRSQSYVSSATRMEPFRDMPTTGQPPLSASGAPGYSSANSPDGRPSFLEIAPNASPALRSERETGRRGQAVVASTSASTRGFRANGHQDSFQDEGCSLS